MLSSTTITISWENLALALTIYIVVKLAYGFLMLSIAQRLSSGIVIQMADATGAMLKQYLRDRQDMIERLAGASQKPKPTTGFN